MTSLTPKLLLLTALPIATLVAQKPAAPAAPQLSPRAAYTDAMHPLDQTRASISNWSDAETQALSVSVQAAAKACEAREPKLFTGDNLIDLARLCGLGQNWPAVAASATLYINAEAPAKPQLIRAYAARLDAELHLKDEQAAFRDGKTMLATLPFDSLTADVINEAIDYMHFSATADAIALARARQPLLIARLRLPLATPMQPAASTPAPNTPAPAFTPTYLSTSFPSTHELYADGIELAALLQFNNQPDDAVTALTELDAALPAQLAPDESLPIGATRARYELLGKPLPHIGLKTPLDAANRLPTLPAPHAVTTLMLFPDWCTQCIRMGTLFPETVFLVHNHEAYFYALMAETALLSGPSSTGKLAPTEVLRGTPTTTVAPAVLDAFHATDFPFLVITDANGIVRLAQPAGEDALQPGGALDSAAARIGDLWPVVLHPSPTASISTPARPADAFPHP